MNARRVVVALWVLIMAVNGLGASRVAGQPPLPGMPPPPGAVETPGQVPDVTPARVSYLYGEVSFRRPGAEEWTPARLNTPLAPGDVLYTGQGGNVEIQVGPRAFVRASDGTQIGLDTEEPDFLQLRMTAGHAALDLRQLANGSTVELDTPHAAFTIERAGYYHVDVGQDATAFRTHRGGSATVTPAGAPATPVPSNQQVVVTGTDPAGVTAGVAPPLTIWDRWNYQRTEYLLQAVSTRYVSPAVYGSEALDQYGSWRTVETYGTVWIPSGMPAGWVPYSTGRWIWDSRFGWTWLDEAPWGWAPYHYGRWVFVGGYWAWAPGPVMARPVYAPALVVFLDGGAVSAGRPLYWAPLGWGEPVIPWWGRPGFVGVAWWGGWGGPRVVNNVVINRATVNVTNITVYQNVHMTNAVLGVPADRFGHGGAQVTRISQADIRQLRAVPGPLEVRPVPASVMPAVGQGARPPAAVQTRGVVATRAPQDLTPTLRAHGLAEGPTAVPPAAPRLVSPPQPANPRVSEPPRGATVVPNAVPSTPGPVPRWGEERRGTTGERSTPQPRPDSPNPVPRQQGEPVQQPRSKAAARPAPPPAYTPRVTPPPPAGMPGAGPSTRSEPNAPHVPPPTGQGER